MASVKQSRVGQAWRTPPIQRGRTRIPEYRRWQVRGETLFFMAVTQMSTEVDGCFPPFCV